MSIDGTADNDVLTGTAGRDIFALNRGGDAADSIHGGGGNGRRVPNGNDTGGHAVTFGADTLHSVERTVPGAKHSYHLTAGDATVDAGRKKRGTFHDHQRHSRQR